MANHERMCSRRSVLHALGMVAAGGVAGALLDACGGTSAGAGYGNASACSGGLCVDLTDGANAALHSVNGALLFQASADTILVLRTSATTFDAVSAVCTHAGCLVQPSSSTELVCNCHGSVFALGGQVLQGPAAYPLRQYATRLSGNTLTLAGA